jgi:hypothetical protein
MIRSHNKKRVDPSPPFLRPTTCFPLSVPLVSPPCTHRSAAACPYTHDEKRINLSYHLPQFNSPHIYRYIPFFHAYHFHLFILHNQTKVRNKRNILPEHPLISFESSAYYVPSFCAAQRSKGMVRQRVWCYLPAIICSIRILTPMAIRMQPPMISILFSKRWPMRFPI